MHLGASTHVITPSYQDLHVYRVIVTLQRLAANAEVQDALRRCGARWTALLAVLSRELCGPGTTPAEQQDMTRALARQVRLIAV